MSDNSCDNILLITEWIKGEGKVCRPCVLPVLLSWYVSELEERGSKEASEKLRQLAEKVDLTPQELAQEMDNIKATIKDPKLAARLREFDCSIQKNE